MTLPTLATVRRTALDVAGFVVFLSVVSAVIKLVDVLVTFGGAL